MTTYVLSGIEIDRNGQVFIGQTSVTVWQSDFTDIEYVYSNPQNNPDFAVDVFGNPEILVDTVGPGTYFISLGFAPDDSTFVARFTLSTGATIDLLTIFSAATQSNHIFVLDGPPGLQLPANQVELTGLLGLITSVAPLPPGPFGPGAPIDLGAAASLQSELEVDDFFSFGTQASAYYGGAGDDSILLGLGDDTLGGGPGNDTLDGEGGFDAVSYEFATGPVNVNLATGVATGADGVDQIRNFETAIGSAFNDTLTAGAAPITWLEGGAGNDRLVGGTGVTIADFYRAPNPVNVNLGTGIALDGTGGVDTLVAIDGAFGSESGDTLIGDGAGNVFDGLGGDDLINGAGGDDTVSYFFAGSGVTANLSTGLASGGLGTDTLISIEALEGSLHGDVLTAGLSGTTTLLGQDGDDLLISTAGDDVLEGQGGRDTLDGGAGPDILTAAVARTPSSAGSASTRFGAGMPMTA